MAVQFWVKVKPQARIERVTNLAGSGYEVSVHAPPQDGKANERLVKLLADYFSVSKSSIKIVRGHASRRKLIQIG